MTAFGAALEKCGTPEEAVVEVEVSAGVVAVAVVCWFWVVGAWI